MSAICISHRLTASSSMSWVCTYIISLISHAGMAVPVSNSMANTRQNPTWAKWFSYLDKLAWWLWRKTIICIYGKSTERLCRYIIISMHAQCDILEFYRHFAFFAQISARTAKMKFEIAVDFPLIFASKKHLFKLPTLVGFETNFCSPKNALLLKSNSFKM